MAIFRGYFFEGVIPDTYDILGTIVASIGVIIIFYYPRKEEGDTTGIISANNINNNNSISHFLSTFALFAVAAIEEIGGGYLVWKWLRERKQIGFGLIGGFMLFLYGIIPTFQPSNFGRVYAAYGGIFVVMALI